MSHPMTNRMWVTLLYCSLINHFSSHDQQDVSDTPLLQSHWSCLIPWPTGSKWHCLIAVSSIVSHPMTNSMWVTLLHDCSLMSHAVPNSEWVTLLYCSLINHVSSRDQQDVSDTALLQSRQSCLMPWPTACEWHCFIAVSSIMSHPMTNSHMWVTLLYCSLINHVSSHDQQRVSDTLLLQSHHVSYHDQQDVSDTALLQSHQSCLIPWPTGCEWHSLILLPGNLISSMLILWPTGNSEWYSSLSTHLPSHTWPTVCKSCEVFYQQFHLILWCWTTGDSEWHAISASHFSSHDQQVVSDNACVFHVISHHHCQQQVSDAILSDLITSSNMSNRKWVKMTFKLSYPNNLISWPIESQSCF